VEVCRKPGYRDPAGHPRLREAIAHHVGVARGVRGNAEEVIVTCGAQQAVDLIAHVLIERGAVVAVEEPGYPPPRTALRVGGGVGDARAGGCVGPRHHAATQWRAPGLRHAFTSVSPRDGDAAGPAEGAAGMGGASAGGDHRGRLRQRIPLRRPSPRDVAGFGSERASDLRRLLFQDAPSRAAPRILGRAAVAVPGLRRRELCLRVACAVADASDAGRVHGEGTLRSPRPAPCAANTRAAMPGSWKP
jgi:Aminotransferase class I and II